MLILLTHPEAFPKETDLLNEMLAQHESLLVHVRKPDWDEQQMKKLLEAVNLKSRNRVVIHSHHHLAQQFGLKGIHLTERDRQAGIKGKNVLSTSFHNLATARREGRSFEYFFCSPVYESITKAGYHPMETWNLSDQPVAFRSKAVALGGVTPDCFEELQRRGFEHFAVLGFVWNSADPLAAIRTFAP